MRATCLQETNSGRDTAEQGHRSRNTKLLLDPNRCWGNTLRILKLPRMVERIRAHTMNNVRTHYGLCTFPDGIVCSQSQRLKFPNRPNRYNPEGRHFPQEQTSSWDISYKIPVIHWNTNLLGTSDTLFPPTRSDTSPLRTPRKAPIHSRP